MSASLSFKTYLVLKMIEEVQIFNRFGLLAQSHSPAQRTKLSVQSQRQCIQVHLLFFAYVDTAHTAHYAQRGLLQ